MKCSVAHDGLTNLLQVQGNIRILSWDITSRDVFRTFGSYISLFLQRYFPDSKEVSKDLAIVRGIRKIVHTNKIHLPSSKQHPGSTGLTCSSRPTTSVGERLCICRWIKLNHDVHRWKIKTAGCYVRRKENRRRGRRGCCRGKCSECFRPSRWRKVAMEGVECGPTFYQSW